GGRQRVVVGDEEVAFHRVLVLQLQVLLDGTEVVAEVQLARGLDPRKDSLLPRRLAAQFPLLFHVPAPYTTRPPANPAWRSAAVTDLRVAKEPRSAPGALSARLARGGGRRGRSSIAYRRLGGLLRQIPGAGHF